MNEKSMRFLEKWNEMMDAAMDIEEFEFKFRVSISSNSQLISEREKVIGGINDSFNRHNMSYKSTSSN